MKDLLKEIKERFIERLSFVDRPGIEKLMVFMERAKFYEAPASSHYHLAFSGGLMLHSWNVFQIMKGICKTIPEEMNRDSIIIVSLLHDLCKVAYYKEGWKWYKGEDTYNKWVQKDVWQIEDKVPLGHGEKSLYLIQKCMSMKIEEACAIRWHMGFTDPGTSFFYPSGAAIKTAWEEYNLARAIHSADMMAPFSEKEMSFFYKDKWYEVGEGERFIIGKNI